MRLNYAWRPSSVLYRHWNWPPNCQSVTVRTADYEIGRLSAVILEIAGASARMRLQIEEYTAERHLPPGAVSYDLPAVHYRLSLVSAAILA